MCGTYNFTVQDIEVYRVIWKYFINDMYELFIYNFSVNYVIKYFIGLFSFSINLISINFAIKKNIEINAAITKIDSMLNS